MTTAKAWLEFAKLYEKRDSLTEQERMLVLIIQDLAEQIANVKNRTRQLEWFGH